MKTHTYCCKVCDNSYEEKARAGNHKAVRVLCPKHREIFGRCAKCEGVFLDSDMARGGKDGRGSYCKRCFSIYRGALGIHRCTHCKSDWMMSRGDRHNGHARWLCPECLDQVKHCKKCDETKPIEDFHKRSDAQSGRTAWCKVCIREKSAQAAPAQKLKQYQLTVPDYEVMLASQDGVCKICRRPEEALSSHTGKPMALAVDHCHVSMKNRGLLCQRCNQALGLLRDDVEIVKAALEYLSAHAVSLSPSPV